MIGAVEVSSRLIIGEFQLDVGYSNLVGSVFFKIKKKYYESKFSSVERIKIADNHVIRDKRKIIKLFFKYQEK